MRAKDLPRSIDAFLVTRRKKVGNDIDKASTAKLSATAETQTLC